MKKQKDDMQVNVAGLRRNIKNLAHNYSDAQVKVREATSNDPWGPSAAIMAEIADLTYNVVAFSEIMQMIWKRLNDHGKYWRHVYKALILLEYLIKTGTEKVAQQCKENIFAIQTLREFVHFDEGKDQGTHVREKAKQLVNLIKDDEILKNERIKALKAKERFALHPSGFGSDGYIDGPSHRDMPPGWQEEPKPASELEMVRPQTAGEEELQLQLAMAMSREEAEQEEVKRRNDDVRLQMALSQSEQDFKKQGPTKKEEPQSHLLDLLDISLGATSISSPPLGAVGGTGTDPWVTPARAASQLSDPWSGASSPPIDPWQPAAHRYATNSVPLGAIAGGIGNGTNGDAAAWALRTQSPSAASGSSPESWLQTNGALVNGNSTAATTNVQADPWLSKTTIGSLGAPINPGNSNLDPWLTDGVRNAAVPETHADPWTLNAPQVDDDPWKSIRNATVKVKPSPDMDDFDIITNRNKTGDLLVYNNASGSSTNNNNNVSLLDEMDPLSLSNSSATAGITTNARKPLKTPQAFLGENSSLVNLDNLIKPVLPQSQLGNAAYNPFSDTMTPPKTNLFQQQQPAVPSINQLKQQQPFAMSINQDPWAPVNNAHATSQGKKDNLFDDDYEDDRNYRSNTTLNSYNNNSHVTTALIHNDNNNNNNNYNNGASDYDIFNNWEYSCTSNSTIEPINSTASQSNDNVDNLRNMQISTTSKISLVNDDDNKECWHRRENEFPNYSTFTCKSKSSTSIVPYKLNDNNNKNSNLFKIQNQPKHQCAPNYAGCYSNPLTASLPTAPVVKISPFIAADFGSESDNFIGGSRSAIFNFDFYEGPPIAKSASSTATATSSTLGFCKMENNNNNNNNVNNWMKPEGAASNPFLS